MAKKGKKGGLGGLIASGSEIKKNIGPRAINGAIRIGSGYGTAFLGGFVKNKISDTKKHKFVDMGAVLLGTAIDVVSNNEMVRSIGQGMQVVGGLETIQSLVPQEAPPKANGIKNATNTDAVNGLGNAELEEKIKNEWDAVVNQNNGTNGVGNANTETEKAASIAIS